MLDIFTYAGIRDETGAFVVKPILIPHNKDITPIKPTEFIYCDFSDATEEQLPLFAHAQGYQHPFGPADRLKIIYSIILNDAKKDLALMERNREIGGEQMYQLLTNFDSGVNSISYSCIFNFVAT